MFALPWVHANALALALMSRCHAEKTDFDSDN